MSDNLFNHVDPDPEACPDCGEVVCTCAAVQPPTGTCPICKGPGVNLGSLGGSHWFRCRNCGMEFEVKGLPRGHFPPEIW